MLINPNTNMETILDLFVVKTESGKYFRAKGYNGSGLSFVDDIKKARLYTRLGPARSCVTYFKNYNKMKLEIVQLLVTGEQVFDDSVRITKQAKALENKKLKAEQQDIKNRIKKIQTEIDSLNKKLESISAFTVQKTQLEIDELKARQNTLQNILQTKLKA